MIFYNWSGGMESSAMLVVERERILDAGAVVTWANTEMYIPEMTAHVAQVQERLGLRIVDVPRAITFEEFLFERGGMLRKGMNDCSRRMKRSNLHRHMRTYARPYEVNLGYNASEQARADDFVRLNEREWLHWRFPLLERGIEREETEGICERAGLTVVVDVYKRYGRFDCIVCPNQTDAQARAMAFHYPEGARLYDAWEQRKGHSFKPLPLRVILGQGELFASQGRAPACACFGGIASVADEIEADNEGPIGGLP